MVTMPVALEECTLAIWITPLFTIGLWLNQWCCKPVFHILALSYRFLSSQGEMQPAHSMQFIMVKLIIYCRNAASGFAWFTQHNINYFSFTESYSGCVDAGSASRNCWCSLASSKDRSRASFWLSTEALIEVNYSKSDIANSELSKRYRFPSLGASRHALQATNIVAPFYFLVDSNHFLLK